MDAFRFVTVSILLFVTWRPVSSQILDLGEGTCLLSRVDIIECTFRRTKTTPIPRPNTFEIYRTRFLSGDGGAPVCRILNGTRIVRDIEGLGNTNRVLKFFSPGLTLDPPERYGNQQYVIYNVQCPEGRLAFFNITQLEMEPANCEDPRPGRNNTKRCVDYIQVQRGGSGVTESCGTDVGSGNTNQLEFGSFSVLFRTSQEQRQLGFEASVVCFDPGEPGGLPLEGCTRPPGSNMTDETPMKRRRKRDLEDFHKRWQRHAAYITRMKRQVDMKPNDKFRFLEINVSHGINVTYSDKKLVFTDTQSIVPESTIENIIYLYTFDTEGTVAQYREEAARVSRVLIQLPGPGPMFIVGSHAYFQLFVIDPRGLIPNPQEMAVIANLTEAQLGAIVEDEGERLATDFLNPPIVSPVDIGLPPLFRGKRQAEDTITFDDQVVLVALENENACNPVLRASANSIIESTDPERVVQLREMLATDAPTAAAPGSGSI